MECKENWVDESTSQINHILTDIEKIWLQIGLSNSCLAENQKSTLDGVLAYLKNALSTAEDEKAELEQNISEVRVRYTFLLVIFSYFRVKLNELKTSCS